MGVGEILRMMVLLKLEGRQNQRKVVVELVLEVEVGVGGSDCEAQGQRDEGTWHLMKGKHLLRPLRK
jgi:hypothetical protein